MTTLGRKIVVGQGVGEADLRSGIWTRGVVGARRLVCQAAKWEKGYSRAETARFLGVRASSVNRVPVSEILPQVRYYLNALQNPRPAFSARVFAAYAPIGQIRRCPSPLSAGTPENPALGTCTSGIRSEG